MSKVFSSPASTPDELLLEPGDEVAAADLVHLVLALRALDELAVTAARESMSTKSPFWTARSSTGCSFASRSCSMASCASTCSSVTSTSRLGTSRPLYSPSVGHRHGLDLEREAVVCGLVERADLQVRGADGVVVEAGLAESLVAPLGDGVLERLAADEVGADLLDHQVDRHAALAEAGELHLAADLGDGAVVGLLHGLGRDLDAELDLVLGCGVDLRLHCGFSVCRWAVRRSPSRGLRTAKWSVRG